MKSFIEHIQKSIYGPEYYQELLARPASFSWKYYGSLAMLVALFLTIISSIPLVPMISKTLNDLPQKFLAYYPDELQVRIVNGHASSTVAEPYFLPIPEIMKQSMGSNDPELLHLGVIDTETPVSLEHFQSYNSFFWVAQDAFVIRDQQGGVRVSPFSSSLNYTVNERTFSDFIAIAEPFFGFVPPLVVIIIFMGMLLVFAVELLYFIFAALLVFIMGRLNKQRWTYGTAFRLCLHAATLPILLGTAFSLVGLSIENIPFLSTALLLGVIFFNLRNAPPEAPMRSNDAPTPPPEDVGSDK